MAAALSSFAGILYFKPQTYEQMTWKFMFPTDAWYYGAGLVSLLLTALLLWWLQRIFRRQPPPAVLSME
jgi:hypothetical protein